MKPDGIAATGWPAVEATCRTKLGISFDEWQAGAGRLILAKRDNGKLAATIGGVGMSLPRQVGKTYLLAGLLFGLCINEPGLLVIWTAHHARTHGETFLSMQAFARRSKAAPYIDQVYTGSGDEEVRFRNGSRILFGARERGFGRGIPGVDVLVMDEAQILSDKALENMLATLNTSQFGLHLYIGTPPKPDDNSEAFVRMRTEALEGESEDLVWIECGADEGAHPTDRKQWAKANPSYPHRTPAESIERLRRKLVEDGFMREGLGVWQTVGGGLISSEMWARLIDPLSDPTDPVSFGVYANKMQTNAAIGVAAHRPDGKIHVGIVPAVRGSELDSLPGVGWIPARMAELKEQWKPCALVVDGYSAAATLVTPMQELGLEVEVTNATDFARACQSFYTGVVEDTIRHRGAGPLARAATSAKKRDLNDGWAWDRKNGTSDITQLNAVTLALHGLVNHPPQISVYASEELLVL